MPLPVDDSALRKSTPGFHTGQFNYLDKPIAGLTGMSTFVMQ